MHRAGDQTDEPVLLAATSFPLSPRAFYILLQSVGGNWEERAPPAPTPCIPSFLARHHASPPFLRTDPESPEKTRFPPESEPSGPPSQLPDVKRRGEEEGGKKNEMRSAHFFQQ